MSEKCYVEEFTELDCIKRYKVDRDAGVDPLQRAQVVWRNELAMIPFVSLSSASHLVKYFPTRRSLFEIYKNPSLSEAQKRVLVAKCFGGKSDKITVSDMIYRYMTTNDPNEFI